VEPNFVSLLQPSFLHQLTPPTPQPYPSLPAITLTYAQPTYLHSIQNPIFSLSTIPLHILMLLKLATLESPAYFFLIWWLPWYLFVFLNSDNLL
jgi:hypothetical protein